MIRRDADADRVLMGCRSARHAFMPGLWVFPGGAVDASDRLVPRAGTLSPAVEARLRASLPARSARREPEMLALAAIRECFEETGLAIGVEAPTSATIPSHPSWRAFLATGLVPTLDGLALVARAETPPGNIRRFDARFFARLVDDNMVAHRDVAPDGELLDCAWLTFAEAKATRLPGITAAVIDLVAARLNDDPSLSDDYPAAFFRFRWGKRLTDTI